VPGRIGHPYDVLLVAVDVTTATIEQREREAEAAEMRRATAPVIEGVKKRAGAALVDQVLAEAVKR
jgi:hypothetical protein